MSAKYLAAWFGLVVALAVHGRYEVQRDRSFRCSLDGNRIQPIYRVDLCARGTVLQSFCSIACARDWPDRPQGCYWQIRDEASGQALDAGRAHFVLSRVVTVPARRERIHAFRHWADAQAHLERYGGEALPNPLASAASSP